MYELPKTHFFTIHRNMAVNNMHLVKKLLKMKFEKYFDKGDNITITATQYHNNYFIENKILIRMEKLD